VLFTWDAAAIPGASGSFKAREVLAQGQSAGASLTRSRRRAGGNCCIEVSVDARRASNRIASLARPGFTTTELIIVVVIIGIICGFAFPRVNYTQFQMDAAVRVVRMTVQNAQRLAVTRQYNVVVSFDQTHNAVRMLEDNNNNNMADPGERVIWAQFDNGATFATPPVGVNGPVAGAVDGADVQLIDGMPSIIFRRNGAGNTDLEVYLTSRRTNANDFRGVTVLKATGRTDWFKYIGNAWKPGNL
jgi:type II secretory pathway pseudopilin PulG